MTPEQLIKALEKMVSNNQLFVRLVDKSGHDREATRPTIQWSRDGRLVIAVNEGDFENPPFAPEGPEEFGHK